MQGFKKAPSKGILLTILIICWHTTQAASVTTFWLRALGDERQSGWGLGLSFNTDSQHPCWGMWWGDISSTPVSKSSHCSEVGRWLDLHLSEKGLYIHSCSLDHLSSSSLVLILWILIRPKAFSSSTVSKFILCAVPQMPLSTHTRTHTHTRTQSNNDNNNKNSKETRVL